MKSSKNIYEHSKEKKDQNFKLNNIKFENVSFSYPSVNFPILSNLNFEINKGDRIAIIGETGSGKTTLLNLISTLIFPSSGKIIINGHDRPDLYKNVRNNIGYVSQSVYLSDNSIILNISLSHSITENEKINILSILKSLNLDVINNKSVNEIASIGERGSMLSGGQIQRIGIARALFRNPSILILDESTNALDEENEIKILDFLIKEFKNKIIIFCSHKKNILKYCNKILEVKKNTVKVKIVKDGD